MDKEQPKCFHNGINRFECVSAIDEERPDFDVVALTFKTAFKKVLT
jgi:hypothetical protein